MAGAYEPNEINKENQIYFINFPKGRRHRGRPRSSLYYMLRDLRKCGIRDWYGYRMMEIN